MLKKLLLISAILFASASLANAQGGPVLSSGIVVLGSTGRPVAGATVTFCNSSATGIPCSPTIAVYSDPGLTIPTTNPQVTDGNGNVSVYALAGNYKYTVTGQGVSLTGQPFSATVPGGGGGGGGIGGALVAGQTVYASATNTVAGGTVVLDMAGIAGADIGAKMNNCIAQLPSGIGVCDGSNIVATLTLSTAVTASTAVNFKFCGQSISQTARITFSGNNSSLVGCPGQATTFTKGANIDQITVSGQFVTVSGISLAGNSGSFTGNGIALNAASNSAITRNTISNEANFGIWDEAGTFNLIEGNDIESNIVHAIDFVTASANETVSKNHIADNGVGTGSLINCEANCSVSIVNNQGIVSTGSQSAITMTANNFSANILNNQEILAQNAETIVAFATSLTISGNTIYEQSALSAIHVTQTGGHIVGNMINTLLNGIKMDGNNQGDAAHNTINVSDAGGGCGVLITGDSLGISVSNTTVNLGSFGNDYGACILTTSGHMFNIHIDGLAVNGFSLAGSYALFYNNSGNLNTSVYGIFEHVECVHTTGCYKRIDSQNNLNVYRDALTDFNALDAGTGSTNDVIIQSPLLFANLPSPAGNGSQIYCSDCTTLTPTTSGGTGAFLNRFNGVWSGGPVDSAGNVTGVNMTATGAVNFSAATHTRPTVVVASSASLPAGCGSGELGFVTGSTAGQNIWQCNGGTWTQQLNSGAAGASTALSNLAAVAINTSLIPGAVNTVTFGNAALPGVNVFLGTAANKAFSFAGLASLTANRTGFVPDAASTLVQNCPTSANQFIQSISVTTGACTLSLVSASASSVPSYAADAGTSTAYAVTLAPALTAYGPGLTVRFLPLNANSSTTPTLNVNGLGAATITKFGTVALSLNDLVTTSVAVVVYDGTRWQLQNPNTFAVVVTAGSATTFTNKITDAEATGNAISVPAKALFPAAGCSGGTTAGPSLVTGSTNIPTPQCVGSTVPKGVLQFARGNAAFISSFQLPSDWNASVSTDIQVCFTTTDTTNGHVTSFNVQTGFNKTDGTVTDDPSLNALQAASVTTGASQVSGGELCATLTSMTMTGSNPGYNFEVAIARNNSGTDTNTDTAVAVKYATITFGRTMNAANR